MEKNRKFNLDTLVQLQENENGRLIGGFSSVSVSTTLSAVDPVTNNCNGGNCASGCQTNKFICG